VVAKHWVDLADRCSGCVRWGVGCGSVVIRCAIVRRGGSLGGYGADRLMRWQLERRCYGVWAVEVMREREWLPWEAGVLRRG